jgi:hypothetical protein
VKGDDAGAEHDPDDPHELEKSDIIFSTFFSPHLGHVISAAASLAEQIVSNSLSQFLHLNS